MNDSVTDVRRVTATPPATPDEAAADGGGEPEDVLARVGLHRERRGTRAGAVPPKPLPTTVPSVDAGETACRSPSASTTLPGAEEGLGVLVEERRRRRRRRRRRTPPAIAAVMRTSRVSSLAETSTLLPAFSVAPALVHAVPSAAGSPVQAKVCTLRTVTARRCRPRRPCRRRRRPRRRRSASCALAMMAMSSRR